MCPFFLSFLFFVVGWVECVCLIWFRRRQQTEPKNSIGCAFKKRIPWAALDGAGWSFPARLARKITDEGIENNLRHTGSPFTPPIHDHPLAAFNCIFYVYERCCCCEPTSRRDGSNADGTYILTTWLLKFWVINFLMILGKKSRKEKKNTFNPARTKCNGPAAQSLMNSSSLLPVWVGIHLLF